MVESLSTIVNVADAGLPSVAPPVGLLSVSVSVYGRVGLGVGVQFGSQGPPSGGVFVEGRYFRIFNYNTQRDDLLLASAGLRIIL